MHHRIACWSDGRLDARRRRLAVVARAVEYRGFQRVAPAPHVDQHARTSPGARQLAGVGVSSPIVPGDRVFVTSQIGTGESRQGPRLGQGAETNPGERSRQCCREERFRPLCRRSLQPGGRPAEPGRTSSPQQGELPAVHDKHNLASPSPVTDGERVYAVFGTGQVAAVDMGRQSRSGRAISARSSVRSRSTGATAARRSCTGTLLILVCYHDQASYILALDTRTGKQLWKTDRPAGTTSYSTPLVVPTAQGDELVVNSSARPRGVRSGDRPGRSGTSTSRTGSRFRSSMHDEGIIYLSRGYRSGPYAAIRPGGRGDISKTHVVWHVPTGAPYISSLVHYQGLSLHGGRRRRRDLRRREDRRARLARADRRRLHGIAGRRRRQDLPAQRNRRDDRAQGRPRTRRCSPATSIDGRILASPAISGGRLFIRTDDSCCIGS